MRIFSGDAVAEFIERPNRFIIIADLEGRRIVCHCPNTGRMKELLYPGVKIIVEKSKNPERKTEFTAVAVYKGDLVVPITSARANDVAEKLIIPYLYKDAEIKREVTYKKSRFDFLVKRGDTSTFIEVKSCTLFLDKRAVFPDAPTSRGLKHLIELEDALNHGYSGGVILVVFNWMAESFSPNSVTDPAFAVKMEELADKIDIIPFKVGVKSSGEVYIPHGNPLLPLIFGDNPYEK